MKLIRKLGTRINKTGHLQSWGEFLCPNPECNKIVERILDNGKRDKSCGCKKNTLIAEAFTIHGGFGTRLYRIWAGIKTRILNSNNYAFKDYGGRGITICNEWLNFIPFRDWSLNHGYADNLTIDRKENDGNYEPSNCQWLTRKENNRKRGYNKIKNIEQANEIRELNATGNYTQQELAEMYGVSREHISSIINNKIWK